MIAGILALLAVTVAATAVGLVLGAVGLYLLALVQSAVATTG